MATPTLHDRDCARYEFAPGHVLARKYEVMARVGRGVRGEIYMLSERATGIERTAKFFHPELGSERRAARQAQKLHKLRHCEVLVPYRTQETISVGGRDVTFLVSDFVHGEPLTRFVALQPGRRLTPFEALHLLRELAVGVEKVHAAGEHHGSLVAEHVLVQRRGLGFRVRLLDLSAERSASSSKQDDVYDLLRMFYDVMGGAKAYAAAPAPIKDLCLGMRRTKIRQRYRDAGELRRHLETLDWR